MQPRPILKKERFINIVLWYDMENNKTSIE